MCSFSLNVFPKFKCSYYIQQIGQSMRSKYLLHMLDSGPRGPWLKPHRRHCVVSLSKNINPSLVLVEPRKARPFITERLLMGRKESNKQNILQIVEPLCNKYQQKKYQNFKYLVRLGATFATSFDPDFVRPDLDPPPPKKKKQQQTNKKDKDAVLSEPLFVAFAISSKIS